MTFKQRSVLPRFGLTLGYSVLYLSLIVLIPLGGLLAKTTSLTWEQFWNTVSDPRVVASYRLTFGAALIAAVINATIGAVIQGFSRSYRTPLEGVFITASQRGRLRQVLRHIGMRRRDIGLLGGIRAVVV